MRTGTIIEQWKRGIVIAVLFALVVTLSVLLAVVPMMMLASALGKSTEWAWSCTAVAALLIAPFILGGAQFAKAIKTAVAVARPYGQQ